MWQVRQRIISRSEPELGLGMITNVDQDKGFIQVSFSESNEVRNYSQRNAPVQRFSLALGEKFQGPDGEALIVESVTEEGDFFRYESMGQHFWEYEIKAMPADQSGVLEKFFSGNWSHHRTFDLRQEAWKIKGAAQATPVRGLVGARVSPLPHQLYIASEVSRRPFPRVLLADEVGLGKTIEAGLIYSSLKSLGRAERVLIVTPEPLVHQWMTEIYRRFGDMFSVLNRTRCDEEEGSQLVSAFSSNQRILVSMEFLLDDTERRNQALAEQWDLIIIDEAHHLDWDEEEPDDKWLIAEQLSKVCWSLLLLTATPRQHGLATQFGLLKLVDPDRYSDFDVFLDESQDLKRSADLAKEITASPEISEDLKEKIRTCYPDDESLLDCLEDDHSPDENKKKLLRELVDRHGTGRVLFRNRRERLKGFPKRHLIDVPLEPSKAYQTHVIATRSEDLADVCLMDFATGRGNRRSFVDKSYENPRYQWLAERLKESTGEKCLVICASKERVLELSDYLQESSGKDVLVFHEDLNIVERDRQAARFADPKGPDLLISSEIGGEGRNFQFAKTLILMDIPRLPDLLEQRIGRLDRIGQGKQVNIVIPWLKGTPEEVLFKWYHQGLGSFETSWNGADPLLEHFADDLLYLFRAYFPDHPDHKNREDFLNLLIQKTKEKARETKMERAASVDVLLDHNSFKPETGLSLQEQVEDCDDDPSIEFFMKEIFDHYGVEYEELDDRGSLIIRPESLMFIDHFPGLGDHQDTMVTFDRDVALAREDISFITQDHPMLEGCLSLLLERNEGVASLCQWPESGRGIGIMIDVSVILSAIGPKNLELEKYLPVSCKEYSLDQNSRKVKKKPYKENHHLLVELKEDELPFNRDQLKNSLAPVLETILMKTQLWSRGLKEKAILKAQDELSEELERLEYLHQVNPSIPERELDYMRKYRDDVIDHLRKAEPRIDGLRVILCS